MAPRRPGGRPLEAPPTSIVSRARVFASVTTPISVARVGGEMIAKGGACSLWASAELGAVRRLAARPAMTRVRATPTSHPATKRRPRSYTPSHRSMGEQYQESATIPAPAPHAAVPATDRAWPPRRCLRPHVHRYRLASAMGPGRDVAGMDSLGRTRLRLGRLRRCDRSADCGSRG